MKNLNTKLLLLIGLSVCFPTLASDRFEDIIEDILPAAVVIESDNGHGSGTILTPDGIIVSNLHVITQNKDLRVKLSNGSRYDEVQILGFDEENDIAIIKVDGKNLPHVPLNKTSDAQIGQTVYALGAPEGLEQTLSKGIVSSLRDFDGVRVIQTDAAISSGSSGGGLFSQNGELLGILVSYFKEGQNLNFAIPSDLIPAVLESPLSLSESEFFALELNQTNSYNALNAMSSSKILETFLERASEEYKFKYEASKEENEYIGLFDDEIVMIFTLYENLLLITLPLALDVELSNEQFIEINTISVNLNYSYIAYLNKNLSIYAEIPIRNVQFEAFEAVFSGSILSHVNSMKEDVIVKIKDNSTTQNIFDGYPNKLPDVSFNNEIAHLDNYTKRSLPDSMAFYYDNSRFNFELVEESQDMHESMLTPIKHRVYAKVVSEILGDLENTDEATVAIFDAYFEDIASEQNKFEIFAKGTRLINGMSSVWAQYEVSYSGIRFKFQSAFLIVKNRGFTIHTWSPSSFSETEKEMVNILQALKYNL